jgi:hypothetical protein
MALARPLRFLPPLVIALVALTIVWAFAVTVLRNTRPMGLPLDDSYIYLTYAKQIGRGEPFTYFSGGGYSAGSTSVLWPMVLAPFWTLGARGHALVWVSYLLCAALYTATAIGVWRVIKKLGGGDVAGLLGALLLLGVAPFAWTSLSGMEVAFASSLLVAMILLLLDQPANGPPSKRLGVCLAAASLSRPEATLIAMAVIGVAIIGRLRKREFRAAAWWAAPVVAPLAWLVANKLIAGNFFPNTGVAKSYFYLPGFDWSYWRETVWSTSGKLMKGVFYDDTSPLVWPKLVSIAWLVGAVRVMLWAKRAKRLLAGALIVAAPLVLLFAVVATSGLWSFQNYRYIGPAFPLLMIPVGYALAPIRSEPMSRLLLTLAGGAFVVLLIYVAPFGLWLVEWSCAFVPFALILPTRVVRVWFASLLIGLYVRASIPGLQADARLFAQGALDTNTQVVAIGEYLHDKLPSSSIMFHDAGAIAYYGDGRVYDMLGLVTNHQAGIANNGAGSRFEFLESLPPSQRPTHFAYYPSWLGTTELYGELVFQTPLRPRIKGLTKSPLVGDADMQIIEANFDHVGTGEHPLLPHPGMRVVDRIDVADLASERAHVWHGELGRRSTGDPTARWSIVGRDVGEAGLVLDGGRTIRGGPRVAPGEQFTIAIDPAKPVRLVMRTGGQPGYPFHESIGAPVQLRVFDGSRTLATATVPVPDGHFLEIERELPAGISGSIRIEASAPYRVFHWFVLQPN